MNQIRYVITYLLLSVLLCFTGTASSEIRVIDDLGYEVVLSRPAQRVISLAPHITEQLFAVGAGEAVVGVVTYSNYPEAALQKPLIGSYSQVNYEAITAQQPDLIVAWNSGNGEQTIERLRQLGFTVFAEEPRTLPDVADNLQKLGILTGNQAIAEPLVQRFLRDYSTLTEAHANKPKVSVFYQVWHDPLITINGEHLISTVIDLCGGRNVFGDEKPIAPRINVESVIAADPDAIVASGMDQSRPEWLDEWKQWHSLRAVNNGHLFHIEPDLLQRHSPRIIEGAKQMCEKLNQVRERT